MANEKIPEYDDVKEEIGDEISSLLEDILQKSMAKQSPKGIEPEKNGGFSAVVNHMSQEFSPAAFEQCEKEFFSLSIGLFKPKTQEGPTGSDYAIIFELFNKGSDQPKISKTTLVQAKVGNVLIGKNTKGDVSFTDNHCKGQLENIEKLSPNDGFLIVYTDNGCYSVPAKDALKNNATGNTFHIPKSSLKVAGAVGQDLAICTCGNVKEISPVNLKVNRTGSDIDLDDYVAKLAAYASSKNPKIKKRVSKVIKITATLQPKPTPKLNTTRKFKK